MRPYVWLALVPLSVLPLYADTSPVAYTTQFETGADGQPLVQLSEKTRDGKTEKYVTVRFKVRRGDGKTPDPTDRVVVQEDGVTVAEVDLFQPQSQALATVLCLDISGSMAASRKIQQAQAASLAFLSRLNPDVDTGLILFDDQVREDASRFVALAGEPSRYAQTRDRIRALIQAAKPEGGTAYLDAVLKALKMLGTGDKLSRKAVVLMTDGADLASKAALNDVIKEARRVSVPVYTIGIGQAGNREIINTVLVLDKSGSMKGKASDTDARSKIEALHEAACRFIDLTRPNSRTTLLPFSTTVATPRPPTSDRAMLKRRIREITAEGGTRLYDAILDGIDTVAATAKEGKRVVVVLTDGRDESPGSRASPVEIIRRAKEEKVTLYTLGLGREHEINKTVLEQLAKATGGEFFHASNQQRLMNIFEKLSLDLYDDGIDEESLQTLAESTGGRYFHVKDAGRLELIFPELAQDLQETYTATFRSRRQLHDGTARGITLGVVRGGTGSSGGSGQAVSNVVETAYTVRGLVVVPEVDPLLYVLLLAVLVGLVVLPGVWKRRTAPSA
jgi:VWFA-related protein